jgi:hypothetical protein
VEPAADEHFASDAQTRPPRPLHFVDPSLSREEIRGGSRSKKPPARSPDEVELDLDAYIILEFVVDVNNSSGHLVAEGAGQMVAETDAKPTSRTSEQPQAE